MLNRLQVKNPRYLSVCFHRTFTGPVFRVNSFDSRYKHSTNHPIQKINDLNTNFTFTIKKLKNKVLLPLNNHCESHKTVEKDNYIQQKKVIETQEIIPSENVDPQTGLRSSENEYTGFFNDTALCFLATYILFYLFTCGALYPILYTVYITCLIFCLFS